MPLIAFWKSNPSAVQELRIEQVVAAAGDGALSDNSECSREVREFFSQISSSKLAEYADQCLSSKFDKSGYILQDVVNELGRRLDYSVDNGRYQGVVNSVGFDGVWRAPEGNFIVAEVKTSDAYRVSLDRIAEYCSKLAQSKFVDRRPSVVVVVGRQDTGELEAQIRGSRHAWDMRLISVEALCKIVKLKESSEDTETGRKIREILMPFEYTRLDRLVDVMFTAAKETAQENADLRDEQANGEDTDGGRKPDQKTAGQWQFTDSAILQNKRDLILSAVSSKVSRPLIKKSRALYWDSKHVIRVSCTMSKLYDKRAGSRYWYAFHPQWKEFLEEGEHSFHALGCMDLDFAFLIPYSKIKALLPSLNTTTTPDGRTYWHIHIAKLDNHFEVVASKGGSSLRLDPYILRI